MRRRSDSRGLSLIEMIVAIVILGVIAALTIPRFSQAASTSPEEKLRRRLAVLRIAIDRYYEDHGDYPGMRAAGGSYGGAADPCAVINQLTLYTDPEGRVSPTLDDQYYLGPYLRDGMPTCPVRPDAPIATLYVIDPSQRPQANPEIEAVWIYNHHTGYIAANCDLTDADGERFDSY